MKRELIAHEDPKSHVSELFRTLRTNIQFMNSSRHLKSLLVTSTLPGEGKTWVSSNLAIAFAQTDKRVVLIDADMRKCCLHGIFNVQACPGLSNYLAGMGTENPQSDDISAYLRETEIPNLYLLPAGNVPPNPSELLSSPQMSHLLHKLKGMFDLIVIDATPSKLVTDAVVLSRIVDSTIVVVGHNMTKKDDLTKVVKDIKSVGGNIAGVVYNQKPATNKKNNETYYYASVPSTKRKEIEYQKQKEAQVNRTTDMLNRDRNPEEFQKKALKEQEQANQIRDEEGKTPEERATEMLKRFNDYLVQEKEKVDNKNNDGDDNNNYRS